MPTLYPPEYPLRPDAPLCAFGPAFAEAISRCLLHAVIRPDCEDRHEREILAAAALTMLEAFHPRDHLECMMAAQGVAAQMMVMECYRRAMLPGTAEPMAVKLRGNIVQLGRAFSTITHDLEKRHLKPLPPRPSEAVSPPVSPPPPAPENTSPEPEEAGDMETRPDGTPGSLAAYAPEPPPPPYVPGEPPIMIALATRPKPWRMVNDPVTPPMARSSLDTSPQAPSLLAPSSLTTFPGTPSPLDTSPVPNALAAPPPGVAASVPAATRGPLDMRERIFTGDALARFAAARFDPDAPVPPLAIEEEGALVELRQISPGNEPGTGEVVILRYGRDKPTSGDGEE